MQMSTTTAPSAMDQVASQSPAANTNCGDNLTSNPEHEANSLSREDRMAESMRFWQENARRHEGRQREQMQAQENREREERAALLKRHHADQRQKESSKKENVGGHINSFGNHSSAANRRKRSNDLSDAAREEYRLGFAGMGASVVSRPVPPSWTSAPYQHPSQQHQHPSQQHHYQQMLQKMHDHRIMQMHMGNEVANSLPPVNVLHNVMHGGNGMMISNGVNAGESPRPPVPYPVHQHIMHHQPQPNMTQNHVQMLPSSANNGEGTSFVVQSHDHMPSDAAPFNYHDSPHQQNTPSAAAENSTVASSIPGNTTCNQTPPISHLTPTPPAIDVGEQVDDNALQFFASETADIFLQDLGPEDLFLDSDEITDLNETATSSVGPVQQQNSVHSVHSGQNSVNQNDCDPGNSLLSPPFHQTLNGSGPLSSHSVHSQNPMSNGNCNPPVTPNSNCGVAPVGSVSSTMPLQRYPTPNQSSVGPCTSSPMLGSTSTSATPQNCMHPSQQMISQSSEMMPLCAQSGSGMMSASPLPNSSANVQAMQQQHQFASQQRQQMMMQSGGYVPPYSSEMAMMPNGHQIMSQSSMMPMNPQMGMHMMPTEMQRHQYMLQQQQHQRAAAAQQMYRAGMPQMNMVPQHYPMMQQSQRMVHPQMNQHRYPPAMMDPQMMAHQQQMIPAQFGGMGPSTSYNTFPGTPTINQSPMFSQFPSN